MFELAVRKTSLAERGRDLSIKSFRRSDETPLDLFGHALD
jgi:hypothetical protein